MVGILLGGFHHVRAGEQEPSALTLVRQAAAEGLISYKITTPEEFKEIKARAAAVSEDAQARMTEMLLEGKDKVAMQDELLRMMEANPDAASTRKAGAGNDGTSTDENDRGEQVVVYDKAEDMPDEDFSRMLVH